MSKKSLNELFFFIGTLGSSGYNFFVMFLLISFEPDSYLSYTVFIAFVTFLMPIVTFGFNSLIQRDVEKSHSYLLFYLIMPIIIFFISFYLPIENLTYALMLIICNITAIYLKSKNMPFRFAFIKSFPIIPFLLLCFLGKSILVSYYLSFFFLIPLILLLLLFEQKWYINLKDYFIVLVESLKVGFGSYIQGSVIYLEKNISLLLPSEISLFYNFTMDMANAFKMIKIPIFYTWQIEFFSKGIDNKSVLINKNIVLTFVSSLFICAYMIFSDAGYAFYFLILFNVFSLFELLKDYSYNLWVYKGANITLLVNVLYSLVAIILFMISYKYIYMIFIARSLINLIFYIATGILMGSVDDRS